MTNHYEYLNHQEDQAMATFGLLELLMKLGVGFKDVRISMSWAGDATISLEYKRRKSAN